MTGPSKGNTSSRSRVGARTRLASWNVESIRAHLDQVMQWVERNEPEILCLQETKADRKRFPVRPFDEAGFELVIHGGEGGSGGVAIASRRALTQVELGIPQAVAPLDEPRSISALCGGLRIHTCYAPNGRKVGSSNHHFKLTWFALLAAWLRLDAAEFSHQILIGDLNIAPRDVDVWDADRYRRRNLTSELERGAFAALLGDGNMIDLIRDRYGDEEVFTWWNRRSNFYATNRGWRLDHMLCDPATADLVESVFVDREERARPRSADHAPILAEITLPSTQ